MAPLRGSKGQSPFASFRKKLKNTVAFTLSGSKAPPWQIRVIRKTRLTIKKPAINYCRGCLRPAL